MKNTLQIALMGLITIGLFACKSVYYASNPPRSVKKGFEFCFDGKPTGLDTLINIDGYYTMTETKYAYELKVPLKKGGYNVIPVDTLIADSSVVTYIFFENGMVAYLGFSLDSMKEEFESNTYPPDAFQEMFYWGNYVVKEDTLKLQYLSRPSILSQTWVNGKQIFVIENQTTLRILSSKFLNKKKYKEDFVRREDRSFSKLVFTPSSFNMNSENVWLKRKKWFRCKEK